MPSCPCTWRACSAGSSSGRSAPRATGTSVRPAVSRTRSVLRTTSSTGALPPTHETARRSRAGCRAASSRAHASSTPVSTSRTTGTGWAGTAGAFVTSATYPRPTRPGRGIAGSRRLVEASSRGCRGPVGAAGLAALGSCGERARAPPPPPPPTPPGGRRGSRAPRRGRGDQRGRAPRGLLVDAGTDRVVLPRRLLTRGYELARDVHGAGHPDVPGDDPDDPGDERRHDTHPDAVLRPAHR